MKPQDAPVNQLLGRLLTDDDFRSRFVANQAAATRELGLRLDKEEQGIVASIHKALSEPGRLDKALRALGELADAYIDRVYVG